MRHRLHSLYLLGESGIGSHVPIGLHTPQAQFSPAWGWLVKRKLDMPAGTSLHSVAPQGFTKAD